MARLVALMVFMIALGFISTDAQAMCGGGGSGGMGVGRGGGSGASKKAESAFKKWDLPSAVPVASLDTSKFDAVQSQLELSSEQTQKIESLKKQLQDEASKLSTTQNAARQSYDKCNCAVSARTAAQGVASAASACKAFDPNAKFMMGVANILSADQMKKCRELIAKA